MSKYIIKTASESCPALRRTKRVPKVLILVLGIIILVLFLIYCIIAPIFDFSWGLNLFGINDNQIYSREYYILYIESEYETPEDVNEDMENIRLRGGAGNILDFIGSSCIALNVYPTLEHATTVQKNLLEQNVTAKIYTYKTTKYNLKNNTENDQKIIKNCDNYIQNLITNLYELIVKFDTDLINENNLEIEVNSLNILCTQQLNYMSTISNYEDNIYYKKILKIASIMEVLCNKEYSEATLVSISCECKNNLINIILCL